MTNQFEPGRLHHVLGVLAGRPGTSGDVPQQRVEVDRDFVECVQMTCLGAFQTLGEPLEPDRAADGPNRLVHDEPPLGWQRSWSRGSTSGGCTGVSCEN